jgi:hypothetical protein
MMMFGRGRTITAILIVRFVIVKCGKDQVVFTGM